jgi:hypothetical protein
MKAEHGKFLHFVSVKLHTDFVSVLEIAACSRKVVDGVGIVLDRTIGDSDNVCLTSRDNITLTIVLHPFF